MPWPNRTGVAPSGWLVCDGSEYPGPGAGGYDQYWQLYQEIGTTYNTGGETANYFRVPDLQGKLIARGATTANQGQTFGSNPTANNATLTNNHLPLHNHSVGHVGNTNGSTSMNRSNNQYYYSSGGANWKQFNGYNTNTVYTANVTGGSGGTSGPHQHNISGGNRQLDMTTLYIIKYKYTTRQ